MDRDFQMEMDKLCKSGRNVSDISNELSKIYTNLTYDCIRSRVRRYMSANKTLDSVSQYNTLSEKSDNNNIDFDSPITKSVEYKSDGSAIFDRIIALRDGEQLTPNAILKAHGMNPDMWEVLSCKSNFYQQQKKGGSVLNLYQSKVCAKPTTDKISFEMIKENFDNLQNSYKPLKVGTTLKIPSISNIRYNLK